jgi:hypothetical protein
MRSRDPCAACNRLHVIRQKARHELSGINVLAVLEIAMPLFELLLELGAFIGSIPAKGPTILVTATSVPSGSSVGSLTTT